MKWSFLINEIDRHCVYVRKKRRNIFIMEKKEIMEKCVCTLQEYRGILSKKKQV